ncbi:MAG: hypothetical protein ACI9QQ_001717 [Myxococcota bacterium]|jgi:hypothetical protein
MIRKLRRSIAVQLVFSTLVAVLVSGVSAASDDAASQHDHASLYASLYAELLEQFTSETSATVQTRVDYKGLGADPRWKQLLKHVEKVNPKSLNTQHEKIAFWSNAYNIFAIDLVISAYPVESIKDIGSFFTPVWDHEAGRVAGRTYNLDEIEHEILRPLKEPRVHGAIVCASISCPPLARTPFTPDGLEQELNAIVTRWLSSPTKGLRIDRQSKTVTISKIFDWFESDFDAAGGPLAFASPHLPDADAQWIRAHRDELEIEHFDYDWGLNN